MKANLKQLLTRGVEEVIVRKDLEKKLKSGKKLRVKFGIDPTSPYIHLGTSVPLLKLKEFQDLGHQIVLIIGDFTGQIGDTSDKLAERRQLSKKEVDRNMKTYKEQIGKILNINRTEFVYNSSWFSSMSFNDVLKLASHFTVAKMIERENFKDRFKKGKTIGIQEFIYPLMQGYDSVATKTDIEVGGTDQTFNMLAGRTIQQAYKKNPQQVMILALIEGTDGQKMSKSLNNVINITDKSDQIYGKLMSIRDELIIKYLTLCTRVPMGSIKRIEKGIKEGKNPRNTKIRLAYEVVKLYYGEKEAEKAQNEFKRIFARKEKPSKIPEVKVPKACDNLIDLLTICKLASSKSEARRLITQGGVKVDNAKIVDIKAKICTYDCMIIQVGKRKFVKIKIIK